MQLKIVRLYKEKDSIQLSLIKNSTSFKKKEVSEKIRHCFKLKKEYKPLNPEWINKSRLMIL